MAGEAKVQSYTGSAGRSCTLFISSISFEGSYGVKGERFLQILFLRASSSSSLFFFWDGEEVFDKCKRLRFGGGPGGGGGILQLVPGRAKEEIGGAGPGGGGGIFLGL